ncbi:MAG: radical SAM protein [Parasporobacterium sp.]|nr:radical SAM protein [Parasporobacterium sp.]
MAENINPKSLNELLRQLDAEGISGYKRFAAVRRFLNFKARDKGVPISGTFELTPLCNLDCKMCYVHLNRNQMGDKKLLPVETWKNLMKDAVDAGMMYASLTGGECLTYPGFKELYLYLHSMGIIVSILSNGLLLDLNYIEFFSKHPPAIVQITLYGASDDAYEKVTGKRCFDQVWNNILRLKDTDIPLTVAITPNEFMDDGEDVIRLLHSHGIHYSINNGLVQPREETNRSIHDTSIDTYVDLVKLMSVLEGYELYPECDVDEMPSSGNNNSAIKGVRCGAGRSGFTISWDGKMKPCNNFPIVESAPLEDGFFIAWHSINEQANNFPVPAQCQGCDYENACIQCVAAHASHGSIGQAAPYICEWGKSMVQAGIYKIKK